MSEVVSSFAVTLGSFTMASASSRAYRTFPADASTTNLACSGQSAH
jgi:hypothetical protein